jgi:centrosomal CEP192-like protein
MIARALLLTILPFSAFAQLQLFQFDGTNDTAVSAGATVNVGSAAPSDTVVTRFHVQNPGPGPATFQTLSIAGSGFQITTAPSLPYIIASGSEAEFDVNFVAPISPGIYSALLLVNGLRFTLQGTSAPAAVLALAGSQSPLAAGAVINFGSVLQGGSQLQGFTLTNTGTASLTVAILAVSGTEFSGPIGLAAPIALAAGQTASFQVAFQPKNGQSAQGTLQVDQRSFSLTGQGLAPPLPGASITFASTLGASAQQNSVSIPLAAASQVSGTGTLTMQFHPSVQGVADDAAIQFLSGPLRIATVTINPGDSAANFSGQSSLAFQTGTTAGTIVFTLTLPNSTQQASLTIPPAPTYIDTAGAVRRVGYVDLSFSGFDNTYSASQIAFTFYNKTGVAVSPGAITVNAASYFSQYFASSTVGGMFGLLASFPVTGDLTQLASFSFAITNSVGVVTTQQVTF